MGRGRARVRWVSLLIVLALALAQVSAVGAASPQSGIAPAPAATPLNPPSAVRSPITILAQSARPAFPNAITFALTAESATGEITDARLFYRPASSEVTNLSVAAVRRGARIDLGHDVDMRQRYLPPGLDIIYYWALTDSAGNQFTSEPQTFLYRDERFPWRAVTGGQVTIYYYSGNDDFGRDLIDTATRTIQKLNQRFGVNGGDPIHIVVYGNTRDFATSLPPNSAEWIGGQAHPDLGLIVTGIQPGGGAAAEIRRVLPHEISHLLLYQATKNPYGGPPHWLDEGLAVYNQESPDASLKPLLDRAAKGGTLQPLRALNSNFPLDPNEARLSYAESLSLVEYLVGKYGDARLGELLLSFKAELSYDEALQRTLGLDSDGLDRDWKASLGYKGDNAAAIGATGGGSSTTGRGGEEIAGALLRAGLPMVALALVAACGLVLRRRRPAA